MELTPLKTAETAFYEIGVDAGQAEEILDRHLTNLKEFARFMYAYVSSRVLNDTSVVMKQAFVESIKLRSFHFDKEQIRAAWDLCEEEDRSFEWQLDPHGMCKFER